MLKFGNKLNYMCLKNTSKSLQVKRWSCKGDYLTVKKRHERSSRDGFGGCGVTIHHADHLTLSQEVSPRPTLDDTVRSCDN